MLVDFSKIAIFALPPNTILLGVLPELNDEASRGTRTTQIECPQIKGTEKSSRINGRCRIDVLTAMKFAVQKREEDKEPPNMSGLE